MDARTGFARKGVGVNNAHYFMGVDLNGWRDLSSQGLWIYHAFVTPGMAQA